MPGPRVPRELSEMVEQLETQLNKLDAFAQAAFGERKEEFLPEVATKLRVLLLRSRHNTPLLLEVASAFGGSPLDVTLDGPPGVRWSPEQASPQAGDVLSLDAFFDLAGAARRPTIVQVGTAGTRPAAAPHSSGVTARKRAVTLARGAA